MTINYITLLDIHKGMHEENRIVIIQCKNCEGQKIGNHIDWIKDHIKNPQDFPLHKCSYCKVDTKLKEKDLQKIKKTLEV
ncbi:MAG: hypothetical protein PHX21_10650 [bacterium]|nr:hypothetical protein [bacterium]